MKLELLSLRVKECGPLKDVKIDFTDGSGHARPVTVLGGANGSGKTTALELIVALADMLEPHSVSPQGVIRVGGSWDPGQEPPKPFLSVLDRAKYAQMDLSMDGGQMSVVKGEIPSDADLPPHVFGNKRSDRNRHLQIDADDIVSRVRHLIWQQRDSLVEFPRSDSGPGTESPLPWPSVLHFPHYRYLSEVEGRDVSKEEVLYEWVHRYKKVPAFSGSLHSYLIWLDYSDPPTFERVIQFLNSLDFEGKTFGVHRKSLKAIVQLTNGTTHPLEELSSGEQNLLIVLLELRRRLLPHSLVLIDEIENSLHPAFQHRMAQALLAMQKETPFQLIVTTHAPVFLDIFGTESARVLTEF